MLGYCCVGIKVLEVRYWKYMKIGNEVEVNKYLLIDFVDKIYYLIVQWFFDNVINICLNLIVVFICYLIMLFIEMY